GKFGTSAQLDHYLELLARKPGALEHSVALAQERDRGSWPDCFDQLWAALCPRAPSPVAPSLSPPAGSRAPRQPHPGRSQTSSLGWPRTTGPPPATSPTTTSCTNGRHDDDRARAVLRAGSVHRDRPDRLDGRRGDLPARHLDDERRHVPSRARGLRAHRHAGAQLGVRAAGYGRARRQADPPPSGEAMSTPARNAQTAALEALIEAHAIELKLPTVRRRFKAL